MESELYGTLDNPQTFEDTTCKKEIKHKYHATLLHKGKRK